MRLFNVEANKLTLKWESCKEQPQSKMTNFQCGNFWVMKERSNYDLYTLFKKAQLWKEFNSVFVIHKVLFSQILEDLIIFNNSFLS